MTTTLMKRFAIFWASSAGLVIAYPVSPPLSQTPTSSNSAPQAVVSTIDLRPFVAQLSQFSTLPETALEQSAAAVVVEEDDAVMKAKTMTMTTAIPALPHEQKLVARDAVVVDCKNIDELMAAFQKHHADLDVKFSAPTKVWDLAYAWLGFGNVGVDGTRVIDSDTGKLYA